MRLSKKGEYALRSLINLGIAAEMKRDLVQASGVGRERAVAAEVSHTDSARARGGHVLRGGRTFSTEGVLHHRLGEYSI
jgi:hypothetical protein